MSDVEEIAAPIESHAEVNVSKLTLGFWIYLMTDCVLFASLFATFAVLRNNTFGGPTGSSLFSLPYVLIETLVLLASSYSCGLAIVTARTGRKQAMLGLFAITCVLGLVFLGMELSEFHKLIADGNSWTRSGFLSAYFTLVGTHGLHIFIGLLWIVVLLARVLKSGLTHISLRRLTLFSMFWHFLDLIWIFIFTIVYLIGVA